MPAVLWVELRLVAGASEHLSLRFPPRDVTRRMRADPGVRHDALSGARSSVLGQFVDAQTEEEDLIEARAVSYEPGLGIHGVRGHRGPAQRNVVQRDDGTDLLT